MDRVDLLRFCEDALAHYGAEAQLKQAIEECRELEDALVMYRQAHARTFYDLPDTREAAEAIDEIADVLIMAEQMRIAFGESAVDERIAFKIRRQRARMEAGQ